MANEIIPSLNIRDDFTRDISGKLVVDSRCVAARFEKRHDNVLRDIRNILRDAPQALLNFEEFKINDLTGERTSHYMMDRDGFSLLAMGFTGAEAIQWKLKYISAFNELEASVLGRPVAPADPLDALEQALIGWKGERAARIAAQEETARQISARQKAEMNERIKDQQLDRVVSGEEDYTFDEVVRLLQTPYKWTKERLIRYGIILRSKRKLTPSAEWRAQGYCKMQIILNDIDGYCSYKTEGQMLFTPKGLKKLLEIAAKENWVNQASDNTAKLRVIK